MPKVTINQEKCTGCSACIDACPSDVFELKDGKAKVKAEEQCVVCKACEDACPEGAIKVED